VTRQDPVSVIHKLLEGKAAVDMFQANYVSTNGTTMTVAINSSFFPAYPATPFRPQVNETVWVMFVDGVAYMLGPTTPWPGTGTVTSVAGGFATLSTDAGTITATYNSNDSLAAGQTVKIYWSDGPHVIGILATAAAPVTPPVNPGTTPTQHVDTFSAIDAGSWSSGSGWWQSEVWASDTTIGAWFYGTKISDAQRSSRFAHPNLPGRTAGVRGEPELRNAPVYVETCHTDHLFCHCGCGGWFRLV
jgi:hypothetical protein